jgi:hypothetical protein
MGLSWFGAASRGFKNGASEGIRTLDSKEPQGIVVLLSVLIVFNSLDTFKCYARIYAKNMASIHKQPGKPNWFASFTGPDGRRHFRSTGTAEKSLAKRVALEFERASREAKAGRFNESIVRKTLADLFAIVNASQLTSSTIKDFFQSWLKRKEIEAKGRTHERYQTVVNHLLNGLGATADKDISHLSARDINNLRDKLATSLSPSSANFTVKVLRVALNQARRDGLVDTNEASRVSLIKRLGKSQRRPFTLDELK